MDEATYMMRAVERARRGEGHTRPNPAVGAVIVRDGVILGEGWHKKAGHDHAEAAAIKNAKRRGNDLSGATIYVTLEPCSRPGRVGACTDAIIASGIRHVVFAIPDPNPTNRGRAKRVLAAHGITSTCWATDRVRGCTAAERDAHRACVEAARRLIAPFQKHVTTGLPYVTVKLAMSLDGKICDAAGDAKWISSAASRQRTGLLREHVDAIMVGGETVRKDNPSLLSHGKPNADLVRVVVSRSGRLPKDAQIFTDGQNPTFVYNDARAALQDLGRRGFMHVLCEGGLGLATSLAEEGLVDEWLTVLAPLVIGTRPIGQAVRFPGADSFTLFARPL